MTRRLAVFALSSGISLSCLGCGDDEDVVVDIGPTGPPAIVFADPSNGACVSVGDDADARVPLRVVTTELVLRPPGACGQFAQCGHLELFAEDVANNEGAQRVIELLLRKLADRYHDGTPHAGSGEPDLLEVRVEVVKDDGEPLLDHEGFPIADELALVVVPDCAALAP
jgi:hypothetical protein